MNKTNVVSMEYSKQDMSQRKMAVLYCEKPNHLYKLNDKVAKVNFCTNLTVNTMRGEGNLFSRKTSR